MCAGANPGSIRVKVVLIWAILRDNSEEEKKKKNRRFWGGGRPYIHFLSGSLTSVVV